MRRATRVPRSHRDTLREEVRSDPASPADVKAVSCPEFQRVPSCCTRLLLRAPCLWGGRFNEILRTFSPSTAWQGGCQKHFPASDKPVGAGDALCGRPSCPGSQVLLHPACGHGAVFGTPEDATTEFFLYFNQLVIPVVLMRMFEGPQKCWHEQSSGRLFLGPGSAPCLFKSRLAELRRRISFLLAWC